MLDHETSKDPQRTDPQYLKLWELYEQQKGVTEELVEINDLYQQLEDAKKEQSSEDAVFRQLKDLEETLKKQVNFRRKTRSETPRATDPRTPASPFYSRERFRITVLGGNGPAVST
ncbi:hypothetical protein G7054_g13414 [Neopestalotiopsis clavispora]|nr:hypothetical protein G7054_g13414 [Neopestalotiopsis clavispora]